MGWVIPTIVLAATAVILQQFLPFLQRQVLLTGLNRDWNPAISRIEEIVQSGKCSLKHPNLLLGCEDMHYLDGYIYTACLQNYNVRRKWQPALAFRQLEKDRAAGVDDTIPDDIFVAWNLETDTAISLELRGFPEEADRSFHGFDINLITPSNAIVYIINHRVSSSTIEKFSHTPGTAYLQYIKTIPIPSVDKGGAPQANDVLALPELDHKNAFFVTNDHKYLSGFMRKLEDLVSLKVGHVSYYDDENGWRIVAKGIATANGITGTKKIPSKVLEKSIDVSEDDEQIPLQPEQSPEVENLVFVSSCVAGVSHVFSRKSSLDPTGKPWELTPIQDILLPSVIDNLALSHPSGSSLIIAAHADALKVDGHSREPLDSPTRPPSAGAVYRINTRELGSKFYGGGGYTTQPEVEEIFLDPKGVLVNATTTAILLEQVGRLGDLYITGLTMQGILQCKEFY